MQSWNVSLTSEERARLIAAALEGHERAVKDIAEADTNLARAENALRIARNARSAAGTRKDDAESLLAKLGYRFTREEQAA